MYIHTHVYIYTYVKNHVHVNGEVSNGKKFKSVSGDGTSQFQCETQYILKYVFVRYLGARSFSTIHTMDLLVSFKTL